MEFKVRIARHGRGFSITITTKIAGVVRTYTFEADSPEEVAAHLDGLTELAEDVVRVTPKGMRALKTAHKDTSGRAGGQNA